MWQNGVVSETQHTHNNTMNATPKTDSILNGVKQLDGITLSTAEELVRKIRTAETAMRAAQEKFAQSLRDLADELTTEGDGWTFQEIWMTDLRGSSEIMQHLRAKGLDA